MTADFLRPRLAGTPPSGMNALSAVIVLLASCATDHYAALAHRDSRPEKLAVVPTVEQVPKTRVTEIRDANGATVGTAETIVGYRNVISGFSLERGGVDVDEQDFYELARDRDGLDAVARARAKGMWMNRTGLALIVAGTAAAIAVPIVVGREAAPYAVGQWFLSFPIGMGLALFGQRPFDHAVLPATRAFAAIGQPPADWATREE
jgi:hypothetical protein